MQTERTRHKESFQGSQMAYIGETSADTLSPKLCGFLSIESSFARRRLRYPETLTVSYGTGDGMVSREGKRLPSSPNLEVTRVAQGISAPREERCSK